jgi:hypothetical protein
MGIAESGLPLLGQGDHYGGGGRVAVIQHLSQGACVIRKLASGEYRLYSRKKDPKTGKRRNLGTFKTRAAAEKHERAVQFFKRRG